VFPPQPDRFRTFALVALLAVFAWRCIDIPGLLNQQLAGADFTALWAGGRVALSEPARLYDFTYVTALQGWPFGEMLRPFVYPPSALLLFGPLGALPFGVAYPLWTVATGGLFLWGCRRVGAPWWIALFPVVWFVAFTGQTTFLIAGLAALALAWRERAITAGILLGIAAAIKPQLLIFMPIALLAEWRWRTLIAAGLTGLLLCGASAVIWGLEPWQAWFAALPRFQILVETTPALIEDAITPHAWLRRNGWPTAPILLLAPVAAALVWLTVRRSERPADRLIATFGGALLVSPYAMPYEVALLAPGVAAYLGMIAHRRWLGFAVVAGLYTAGLVHGPMSVLMALALLAEPLWLASRGIDPGLDSVRSRPSRGVRVDA